MTLDEVIIHAEEVAEENENVVNTGTFKDGHTVAEMYCDDTECINAHLFSCAKRAKEHRQLAEWLKELKQLREQVSRSENQNKWVPLKTRPMTDEESTFYRDWAEYGAEIFDCPLPDDGQDVLVSWAVMYA